MRIACYLLSACVEVFLAIWTARLAFGTVADALASGRLPWSHLAAGLSVALAASLAAGWLRHLGLHRGGPVPWALRIALAAGTLAVLAARPLPLPEPAAEFLPGYDLWVPPVRDRPVMLRTSPDGPPRPIANDDFGLRNPHGMAWDRAGPRVALVGDSFVYGQGVQDDETLAASLERSLRAASLPDASVASCGLVGTNIVTFPAIARFCIDAYRPALLVVYLGPGDVDPEDVDTRRTAATTRWTFRLAVAMEAERLVAAVRSAVRARFPDRTRERDEEAFDRGVEGVLAASRDVPVLFIDGGIPRTPPIDRVIAARLRGDRGVRWLDAAADPRWALVGTIPGDGHWSAEGTRTVADVILSAVGEALESALAGGPL
jgi:hypothetical protein